MMSSAEVHRSDTMRSNFSTGSRQSSVRDARPQSNGHSMSNGQIGIVREAAQMVEILKREAVFLTGGRDRRGGPVLTFPASNDSGQVSYEDLATDYLCSLPSTESAKLGFTVLFDNREHHYKEVKPLLKLLQDALGSSVFAVYIVQPEKGKLNFSFRRERNLSIEPQNITVAKLKNIIQPNQLSIELGGSLDYKHALWLERRLGLEKFVKEAKNVAMELERTFIQITDRLSRDEKITPQELLRQHQSLQESVIYIPERTIQHGRQLYQDWEDDAVAAGLQVANIERVDFAGPHFTLDQVAAMNHIKKLVEGLEGQLERIQDLWRDRHVQLGDKLQLSEMEQAMRTVVDWILGPAEKLLSSQTDIGTTYETADELRKQHEQLELKCTDSYGTYAELRHKSVDAIEQQPEKAADIEAQRDYMDTVCRSFAARLQRRRNLIITSVRFHRLVNEINQLLDDFFKWLSIDMECEDIKAVEEMLMALNEKCDELIAVCEQAVNEGQNLLDQLSLPVKNAFGQDVSPDNSKHTEHVEMLLGRLQARRGEAEEFAQVRRLKLQQLQQLKKCEGDAEQAITWILELYSAAVQKMSEGTGDPITEQAIQADLRELQDTAKNTYEYGKQLLQAALHLRRSLRYDLSPNNDQAQRLADAWKQFSLGVQERASRLDTQTDFHRRADQVLEDIDRLLVVISQVMNSEITVESLVISHSQLRSSVDNEYELTTAMGQELLHRLQKPMLSQRGQRQMEMEDPYVAAQVENKLKELEAKYKLMHENWLEMTQGLQLARDGTLLGPDRRPWQQQMNQVIEETVTMTTYGSHLQSAPPIERGGSEWERLLQQLREVGVAVMTSSS
ncbi:hypothetical protein CAPTEDRAFT_196990 [Capitella teleta]|uniref:SESTD1-like spectrin repeats region domain-containing protein n=1 Tax=Capitella teleta TaxID=283909 RepID=R7TBA8_CAPTE|nr:hypothetical protein CAPTEDRAFT_196990 [Capitella teleta]|eukprot:ELT90999.1 hypothetical protein CAPTEDRAFT_196990 [Capitella teleta]